MAKHGLYDLIKQLLTDNPKSRDSDKELIWDVWYKFGLISNDCSINVWNFMKAPSTESIRRCRQKIQERHPELRSSKKVQEAKDKKESYKGTFVYREPVQTQLA